MIDRNAGSQDLHDELRQGVQRHDIVHHAQHDDHRRAKQNSLHLPVDVRKDQSRQQKRQKDGKAAQTRNRHLVHAAGCPSERRWRRPYRRGVLTIGVRQKRRSTGRHAHGQRACCRSPYSVFIRHTPISGRQSPPFCIPCEASCWQDTKPVSAPLFVDATRDTPCRRAGVSVSSRIGRDELHDRFADGGLKHAIALSRKLGFRLGHRLAGCRAVDCAAGSKRRAYSPRS